MRFSSLKKPDKSLKLQTETIRKNLLINPMEAERQNKRYWAEIQRVCEENLRALEHELQILREVESGFYEIFHPLYEKPKKTAGRVCIDCGAPLPDRSTGRPLLRCPSCLKKWRKAYQHAKYIERKFKSNILLRREQNSHHEFLLKNKVRRDKHE
jgi:rubrerythrin